MHCLPARSHPVHAGFFSSHLRCRWRHSVQPDRERRFCASGCMASGQGSSVGRRRTRIDSGSGSPNTPGWASETGDGFWGWLVGGLSAQEGRVCVRGRSANFVAASLASWLSWLSWRSGGGAARSGQSASAGGCKFPCRLSAGGY